MRVLMVLLALVVTPLVAVSAQGKSETCKDKPDNRGMSQSAAARAAAPGQAKKACDVPPPPPPAPPPPPPPDVETAEIHGTAFADADANFVRGGDEAGLAGWTVELSGPVSASTLTDGSGNYSFVGLPPGTYVVCEAPQIGYWQSIPMDGVVCGSGMIGYTRVVLPEAPGVRFLGNDFGNVPLQ